MSVVKGLFWFGQLSLNLALAAKNPSKSGFSRVQSSGFAEISLL